MSPWTPRCLLQDTRNSSVDSPAFREGLSQLLQDSQARVSLGSGPSREDESPQQDADIPTTYH